MDKMTHYRELVKHQIQHIADLVNRQYKTDDGEGVAHCVFDEKRDNYLLVKAGWCNGRRSRGTTLFVRLREDGIHVDEDWTEDGVANALIEAGVPQEEIVLAYQSSSQREHLEIG